MMKIGPSFVVIYLEFSPERVWKPRDISVLYDPNLSNDDINVVGKHAINVVILKH